MKKRGYDTTQTKPSAAFPRVYDIHATSSCFVSVILIEIDQSYQNLLQAVLSLVVVHAVRVLRVTRVPGVIRGAECIQQHIKKIRSSHVNLIQAQSRWQALDRHPLVV